MIVQVRSLITCKSISLLPCSMDLKPSSRSPSICLCINQLRFLIYTEVYRAPSLIHSGHQLVIYTWLGGCCGGSKRGRRIFHWILEVFLWHHVSKSHDRVRSTHTPHWQMYIISILAIRSYGLYVHSSSICWPDMVRLNWNQERKEEGPIGTGWGWEGILPLLVVRSTSGKFSVREKLNKVPYVDDCTRSVATWTSKPMKSPLSSILIELCRSQNPSYRKDEVRYIYLKGVVGVGILCICSK